MAQDPHQKGAVKPGHSRGGARPGAGAPRKLTPAVEAKIIAELERGRPLSTSIRLAGLSRSAVYELFERDEGLFERFEQARARGQVGYLDEARTLARRGERTGHYEFLLERLYPKDFRRPPTQHVGGDEDDGDKPIAHEVRMSIGDAIAGARGEEPKGANDGEG